MPTCLKNVLEINVIATGPHTAEMFPGSFNHSQNVPTIIADTLVLSDESRIMGVFDNLVHASPKITLIHVR